MNRMIPAGLDGKDGGLGAEVRSQRTEGGGRKDRCRRSEVGSRGTGGGGHPGEIGKKKAFHWVKKSEDGGRRSEGGSRISGVGCRISHS